ncbi:TIGR02444 family protein [Legionella rowbothamii]|uniref:TIGR02444 family protein n=1 Tax=Legionella rowbothamii TaxID=96229 RepID=UPI001055082D|nr:TIGR02444 family protein [Legionella rowbothamii]
MFNNSSVVPPENPFWQFSLSIYGDSNIQEACHVFQDTDSANVNLVLFAYWLGYAVQDISHEEFTRACASVAIWNEEITKNLRNVRILLKEISENDWIKSFYSQVLTNEIISESYQQELLYSQVKDRLKERTMPNNAMSSQYLYWLFSDAGHEIHQPLKIRIEHFIKIISDKLGGIQKS